MDYTSFVWSVLLVYLRGSNLVTCNEIECYSCSSDLDELCISKPTITTTCSTTHGKGCATKLASNGAIERGCSDIGLTPQGCQVSLLFGTECVCHTDRCNTGIPADKASIDSHVEKMETIDCYDCNSAVDTTCLYTIKTDDDIKLKTCPAVNGCYFMKRIDDDGITIYNRLCFEDQGPATYYPGGCYTVFNDHSPTPSEVCVCYDNLCNKDSKTALGVLQGKDKSIVEKQTGENKSSSHLLSTNIYSYIIVYYLTVLLRVLDIT